MPISWKIPTGTAPSSRGSTVGAPSWRSVSASRCVMPSAGPSAISRTCGSLRPTRSGPAPTAHFQHPHAAADELRVVAEALGDHAVASALEEMIDGTEGYPRSPSFWTDPEGVIERWGIIPGALEGMVTLAPEL